MILRNHSIQKLGLKLKIDFIEHLEKSSSKPLHSETWIETRAAILGKTRVSVFETTPFRNLD